MNLSPIHAHARRMEHVLLLDFFTCLFSQASQSLVCEWLRGSTTDRRSFEAMAVDKARRAHVQKLRRLARHYNTLLVSDTAGRKQVEALHLALVGHTALSDDHRKEAENAHSDFTSSFAPSMHVADEKSKSKAWKFSAVQLTYSSTKGDWASKDPLVLKSLFDRLTQFVKDLIPKLGIGGASTTLEESLESGEHVHAHVYLHMERDFRRKGTPTEFASEDIHPRASRQTRPVAKLILVRCAMGISRCLSARRALCLVKNTLSISSITGSKLGGLTSC